MDGNLKLGRILGIPVSLHWSWFIIFTLITWSLMGMFRLVESPSLNAPTAWGAALITSILFFSSILIHEFGHAIVAIRYQIPVRSISLFVFGGMAQIGQEPESPRAEFRIAAAGPLASLLLAATFWVIQFAFSSFPVIHGPAVWLARINLLLAAFNLIPGYPLDGGRILRAIVWQISGSSSKAHKIAAMGGQIVAFCFIFYGIVSIFTGNALSGLWMAFIGWYLNAAAANAPLPNPDNPILSKIKVSQVMESDVHAVPGSMSVAHLVHELFVPRGFDLFTVTESGVPVGILTINQVASIPRNDWAKTTIKDIMVPLDRVTQVSPEMNIQTALRTMDQRNLSHITVHDGNSCTGVITRDQIHHYLRLLGELGVQS